MFAKINQSLNIRPGEESLSWLLFLYNTLQGTALAFFLTSATSTFLAEFSPKELAISFIFGGLLSLANGRMYAWFEHKLSLNFLLIGVWASLTFLTFFLGWTGHNPLPWMIFLMPIFYRLFYQSANLSFWGLSATVLDVRQSKRLFSFISAGDGPAKLLAYLMVPTLLKVLDLDGLFMMSGLLFLLSGIVLVGLLKKLDHHFESHNEGHHGHETPKLYQSRTFQPNVDVWGIANEKVNQRLLNLLEKFASNPLTNSLAALSLFVVFASTLVDFSFLSEIKYNHGSGEELATVLSVFYSFGKAATLAGRLFLSNRFTEKLGIRIAMMIPPLFLLGFSLLLQFSGAFGISNPNLVFLFGLMAVGVEALKSIFHDPLFLTLFQPLNKHLRLSGHTLVKGYVDPIALTISGVILTLMLLSGERMNLTVTDGFLLVSLLGWIGFIFISYNFYLESLKQAISKRFGHGSEGLSQTPQWKSLLLEKLYSPNAEDGLYALKLLAEGNKTILGTELAGVFRQSQPLVIVEMLKMGAVGKIELPFQQLKSLFEDTTQAIEIRAAAIETLASRFPNEADYFIPLLDGEEEQIQKSLVVGMLRSGDLESVITAGQRLIDWVNNSDLWLRLKALDTMSELRVGSYYRPIVRMLSDAHPLVRRKAILTAGVIKNPKLVELLYRIKIQQPESQEAAQALRQFGPAFIEFLIQKFKANELTELSELMFGLRSAIRVGGEKGTEFLILVADNKGKVPARFLRKALFQIKYQTDLKHRDRWKVSLDRSGKRMALWLHTYLVLKHSASEKYGHLIAAIKEEIQQEENQYLYLLSFLYGHSAPSALLAINTHHIDEKRANALENLEHTLPNGIVTDKAIAVLERSVEEHRLSRMVKYFPLVTAEQEVTPLLLYILQWEDLQLSNWTLALLLQATQFELDLEQLRAYQTHQDSFISSLAKDLLGKRLNLYSSKSGILMENNTHQDQATGRLNEIEKVIVLKSTKLFEQTPESILTEIVPILREEEVAAGEVIFERGDHGACMYIIFEGEIEVYDKDLIFATLGNRDFFGELALLDPEPRSASVRAKSDGLLLRLDQQDFYELIEDQPDVMRGIIQILCRRLRKQNELLRTYQPK